MRKALALGSTAVMLAAFAAAAAPASANSVTFTLTTGALGITQPSTTATLTGAALGTSGTTMTGTLGETVVSDQRGGTLGWESKITGGTALTNGTTTIDWANVKAFIPTGGITTTGTVTASQGTYLLATSGLALSTTAQTLVTGTLVSGANTATFNPNLSIAVPSTATGGTYTGTITQTVS